MPPTSSSHHHRSARRRGSDYYEPCQPVLVHPMGLLNAPPTTKTAAAAKPNLVTLDALPINAAFRADNIVALNEPRQQVRETVQVPSCQREKPSGAVSDSMLEDLMLEDGLTDLYQKGEDCFLSLDDDPLGCFSAGERAPLRRSTCIFTGNSSTATSSCRSTPTASYDPESRPGSGGRTRLTRPASRLSDHAGPRESLPRGQFVTPEPALGACLETDKEEGGERSGEEDTSTPSTPFTGGERWGAAQRLNLSCEERDTLIRSKGWLFDLIDGAESIEDDEDGSFSSATGDCKPPK